MKAGSKEARIAIKIVKHIMTPGGERMPVDHLKLFRDGEYVCGWGYKPLLDCVTRILATELAGVVVLRETKGKKA